VGGVRGLSLPVQFLGPSSVPLVGAWQKSTADATTLLVDRLRATDVVTAHASSRSKWATLSLAVRLRTGLFSALGWKRGTHVISFPSPLPGIHVTGSDPYGTARPQDLNTNTRRGWRRTPPAGPAGTLAPAVATKKRQIGACTCKRGPRGCVLA